MVKKEVQTVIHNDNIARAETELSGTHVWMHTVYIFEKYLIDGDCGWAGLSSIADVHVWLLGRKETPVKTE